MPGKSTSFRSNVSAAFNDIVEGISKDWIWRAIAVEEVKLRYRGSVLGPLWLTITTVVMIVAMGVVFARVFNQDISKYMPYLTIGLVVWQFISTLINEGCGVFLNAKSVILQAPIPFTIYACAMAYRNLIIFAHSCVIIPLVLLFFAVPVGPDALWIAPAVFVLCLNGIWLSLLLGAISARYRDVPPVIASFVQVVFFITPIFWLPELLGDWKGIAELNPMFAAIDVIRAPLLGVPLAPNSWVVLLTTTFLGSLVTFAAFSCYRSRISYWL